LRGRFHLRKEKRRAFASIGGEELTYNNIPKKKKRLSGEGRVSINPWKIDGGGGGNGQITTDEKRGRVSLLKMGEMCSKTQLVLEEEG